MGLINNSQIFREVSQNRNRDRSKDVSSLSKDVVENALRNILPTDDSIDGDWSFDIKGDCVKCYAAFNCIDARGNHVEWLPFCVTVSLDFGYEIGFRGSRSEYVEQAKIVLDGVVGKAINEEKTRLWAGILVNKYPKVLQEVMSELFRLN